MNTLADLISVVPSLMDLFGTVLLASSLRIASASPEALGVIIEEFAGLVNVRSVALIERRSAWRWWVGWASLIVGFSAQALFTYLGWS